MQGLTVWFFLLGQPILLLIGTTITFVLASVWRGSAKKGWVLALGPILTFGITLGARVFVFKVGGPLLGLYMIALFFYYPILLIIGLGRYFKKPKTSAPPQMPKQ